MVISGLKCGSGATPKSDVTEKKCTLELSSDVKGVLRVRQVHVGNDRDGVRLEGEETSVLTREVSHLKF